MVAANVFLNGVGSGAPFLLVWFGGWAIGVGAAIVSIMWNTVGYERIILTGNTVIVTRKIPVWTRKAEYPIAQVHDFRLNQSSSNARSRGHRRSFFANTTEGAIAFTFGNQTIGVGLDLEGSVAQHLLKRIKARHLAIQSQPKRTF